MTGRRERFHSGAYSLELSQGFALALLGSNSVTIAGLRRNSGEKKKLTRFWHLATSDASVSTPKPLDNHS